MPDAPTSSSLADTASVLRVSGHARRLVGFTALLTLFSGCMRQYTCEAPATSGSPLKIVYVVQRGWHTGISISVTDWPDTRAALLDDLPAAKRLEFGWGEKVYYQSIEKNVAMLFDAAFGPSPSVIEVSGVETDDPAQWLAHKVVAVRLTPSQLTALIDSIADAFVVSPQRTWTPKPTGTVLRSKEGQIRFYHANGLFYLPRTCNRWIAERLEAAGCTLGSSSIVSASALMRRMQRVSRMQIGAGLSDERHATP